MARSIVLRFDATCFDCGAHIPAGTTARWFGKGRVSCCGADRPLERGDYSPAAVPSDPPKAKAPAPLAPPPPVPARSSVPTPLSERCTPTYLHVHLRSGASFLASPLDAQHVIACIKESCRDSITKVEPA